MNCPNCKTPFVEKKSGKYLCITCGWLETVGKEWKSCEAPEPEPEPSPEPVPQPKPEPVPKTTAQIREVQNVPQPEPNPAALEPDPAALEPDPAELSNRNVKSYLGGLLTVTEVDE